MPKKITFSTKVTFLAKAVEASPEHDEKLSAEDDKKLSAEDDKKLSAEDDKKLSASKIGIDMTEETQAERESAAARDLAEQTAQELRTELKSTDEVEAIIKHYKGTLYKQLPDEIKTYYNTLDSLDPITPVRAQGLLGGKPSDMQSLHIEKFNAIQEIMKIFDQMKHAENPSELLLKLEATLSAKSDMIRRNRPKSLFGFFDTDAPSRAGTQFLETIGEAIMTARFNIRHASKPPTA